eukprot:COSAG02_NODE_2043_length_10026_cov_10.550217_1_plen_78_part_00
MPDVGSAPKPDTFSLTTLANSPLYSPIAQKSTIHAHYSRAFTSSAGIRLNHFFRSRDWKMHSYIYTAITGIKPQGVH